MEFCGDWTARHDRTKSPPTLRIAGKCCFLTAGWTAKLQRHEPQGFNPTILMLDLVVANGSMSAQVLTEVDVTWAEETDFHYEQVDVHVVGDGPAQGILLDVTEVG